MRKKSNTRVHDTHKPDKHGGEYMWRCLRERNVAVYRNKPGFKSWKKTNTPDGYLKAEVRSIRVEAELLAEKDMINLYELGLLMNHTDPNLDLTPEERADLAMGNEALQGMMALARDVTVPHDIRYKCLAKIADCTKPKPQAPRPQITTVDTGLAWINAIGATAQATRTITYTDQPDDADE